MTDEQLLLAKVLDLCSLCEKYNSPRFSAFLTEEEQVTVAQELPPYTEHQFFGGYADAGRKLLGIFPEWDTDREFPILTLKITKTYGEPLTHRDYLGTILSLGIDRNKIGDILVDGQTAYVFVCSDIAPFLQENISKVGNKGVQIEIVEPRTIIPPKQQFESLDVVAASLRIDAVVAAMLKLSRTMAVKLIEAGRVAVNHRVVEDGTKQVHTEDLLSVRGYGRFKLTNTGGTTRSGRLHLEIKKYL